MQPSISVIVVNYNRARNLSLCLWALKQQNVDHELILTDDGSIDESLAIAQAAGATIAWNPHNDRRTAAARWRGTQLASRDLLVFLDSDIVINPDALAVYWAAYQKNHNRALAGYFKYLPGMEIPDTPEWEMLWNEAYPPIAIDQGQVVVGQDPREAMGEMLFFDDPDAIRGKPFSLISANFAIPRHVYEATSGWDYNMVGRGQDGEFSIQVAEAGYGFSYLMDAKAVHIAHPVGPHTGPGPHAYLAAKYPHLYKDDQFVWTGKHDLERTDEQEKNAMAGRHKLRIRIASPSEVGGRIETQKLWGDHWVKHELENEFRKMGHTILTERPDQVCPDVLIHLSGGGINYIYKKPIQELAQDAFKIVWIYSHPEAVTPTSLKGYDAIFCCSVPFAEKMREMGYGVTTLLGATNKRPVQAPIQYDVGFVGTTRGAGGRPVIADLQASKIPNKRVGIYGAGWTKYVPADWYLGRYVPYEEIGKFYASCKIVLQDHRPAMVDEGFVSVKLFDVFASGSLPVCAEQASVRNVFKDAIPMYNSVAHLRSIIEYYCEKEDERQELIARGQKIALACPWSKRAELLLKGVP